jgi:competence protein ComEA
VSDLFAKLAQADVLPGLIGPPSTDAKPAVRWNPGRRGVLAMALVACVWITVAGAWVLASRPHRLAPVSTQASSTRQVAVSPGGSLASPVASTAPSTSVIVVDVVGKVHRAGVYRLPPGSRVTDAIAAAGGVARGVDLSRINLARKVADGEQIAVGVAGAGSVGVGQVAGSGSDSPGAGLMDLNTATVGQLDGLPGVGPVLAQRILDWRTAHGRFDSVDQLRSVTGIGSSKFSDLKPLVTVS